MRGGSHGFGAGQLWQFKGNELVSGMSGGPVLDLANGADLWSREVTIGEGADRGGYVIPVEGLRHLRPERRRDLLTRARPVPRSVTSAGRRCGLSFPNHPAPPTQLPLPRRLNCCDCWLSFRQWMMLSCSRFLPAALAKVGDQCCSDSSS